MESLTEPLPSRKGITTSHNPKAGALAWLR